MSSVNVKALYVSAQESQQRSIAKKEEKASRIEECIRMFNEKCDILIKKYFDEHNYYSINNSLARTVAKSGRTDTVNLHMNFDRNDFVGWYKFVPFQADEHGRNYNARPASCLRLFLDRAKYLGYLPQISYVVWGNQKFTVKFTLQFEDESVPNLPVSDTSDVGKDTTDGDATDNFGLEAEVEEAGSSTSA